MSCTNTRSCPCTADCVRHGKCCECLAHHKSKGNLPVCFFSEHHRKAGKPRTIEDLYNDSISNK